MRLPFTPPGIYLFTFLFFTVLLSGCATFTPQYEEENFTKKDPGKIIDKRFYLIGDAGGALKKKPTPGLEVLRQLIDTASTKQDYLIFLGDNIYPAGMPKKNSARRKKAEFKIDAQIQAASNFEGKTIFIPGNHDWYSNGVVGLDRERRYVEKKLKDKKSFWPSNGCPIKSLEVEENIQLILLDTQWYLANWNKNPTINDECSIKTREKFFTEIQGELKKNNGKYVVLAMHHPMFTNGPHGGKFHFKNHIFPSKKRIPLPILGSLATQLLTQGGMSPQDRFNQRYNELMKRLETMVRDNDRIVLASGHEHSLQYIDDNGLKQIVSGAGSKQSQASLGSNGLFSYPKQGVAVLDIFKDGSSNVRYFGFEKKKAKLVFQTPVHKKIIPFKTDTLPTQFNQEIQTAIYDTLETDKSNFFKNIWGQHYREVYSKHIKIPVVTLDTLYGGLRIQRQGGGQVTRSLRLVDTSGNRYSLRAMRKSVTQFLQKGAFKYTYLEDGFNDTFTEELLADFYTSSYPYAFMTTGPLAKAIDVYHSNPSILYMPKHARLGNYNKTFGDEMYFIQKRPGKEYKNEASFGAPDDIENTEDMLENLRRDEKYKMDEAWYIRTRLFDMLLGDWDRHSDQWKWARFDRDSIQLYRPIPKDRDQVYSNYDGAVLKFVRLIVPTVRKFQVFSDTIRNVRWLNESGLKLDRTLAKESPKAVWIVEAEKIRKQLTDSVIDKAFTHLPISLQDSIADKIKSQLKNRRNHIVDVASRYYDYMSKQVIITGTDKDDRFEIVRGDKVTEVKIFRLKKESTLPYYYRLIYTEETDEIWIYGLDDDDEFIVTGEGKKPIPIRIIGGQNNDIYRIERGKKTKIYDHQSKPNTIVEKGSAKFILRDNYNQNTFNINKAISKTNVLTPLIGFNPDDGVNINFNFTKSVNGFNDEPYPTKHILKGSYFFATSGFDLSYSGLLANALRNWNFIYGGRYTSENFAQNFFGFGNNSINPDDDLGLNYNRIKIGIRSLFLGINRKNFYGSEYKFNTFFRSVQVQDSPDRFISSGDNTLAVIGNDDDFFKNKLFAGVEAKYNYQSFDNIVVPTRGLLFNIEADLQTNIEQADRTILKLSPILQLYNALSRNKNLVLKTSIFSEFVIGNDFEFYQAASLGDTKGLRGFRRERFTGRSALAFSGDLRYGFKKFKTGILPLQIGLLGGYDIGRVWSDFDKNDVWHNSIGGGFWLNAIDTIAGEVGLFSSDDGLRVSFTLGMNF
ncbi:metallophosphoesterase [Aquimarina sp. ERC-38]|uniref:metallophosphoesterase n=1 Tax=Aquimarina sp. ERC-38 TaxID=2949996 RepID=UPI002247A6C7|nr:metallophosphoesterase [Aquimarina sp. ERC-38]UZO79866.1 metallophosphoesterase [Aquimarina sp. ERC-38]